MTTAWIGQPTPRIDGRLKVTGGAQYAAECSVPNLVHGFVVTSEVARGKIVRIDATNALRVAGVLQVLTHENAPLLPTPDPSYRDDVAPPGSAFRPLQDNEVKFSAQPVALVLAERFALARYAAALVRIEYDRAEHVTDLESMRAQAYVPKRWDMLPPVPGARGNATAALDQAAAKLEVEYRLPVQHHNPMELFGTTVVWDDGKLIVYDKTQGVQNVQRYLGNMLGYASDRIRVIAPFVGGAFGLGQRPQYQVFLAALAAHVLKRSVRLSLSRQQMFGLGYRLATWQRVKLGATPDGTLAAIIHEAIGATSRFEDYTEKTVQSSGMLYQCDNAAFDYQLGPLDLCTPIDMRAPGTATGVYALECAMDELAVKLRIDPLELRLKNYAEINQAMGVRFSSKALRECYRQGALRFGWERRKPEPRSMREGEMLIGWGMDQRVADHAEQSDVRRPYRRER